MCDNPFKECKKPGCHVIIVYKGRNLDICKECWDWIADSEIEWTNT